MKSLLTRLPEYLPYLSVLLLLVGVALSTSGLLVVHDIDSWVSYGATTITIPYYRFIVREPGNYTEIESKEYILVNESGITGTLTTKTTIPVEENCTLTDRVSILLLATIHRGFEPVVSLTVKGYIEENSTHLFESILFEGKPGTTIMCVTEVNEKIVLSCKGAFQLPPNAPKLGEYEYLEFIVEPLTLDTTIENFVAHATATCTYTYEVKYPELRVGSGNMSYAITTQVVHYSRLVSGLTLVVVGVFLMLGGVFTLVLNSYLKLKGKY